MRTAILLMTSIAAPIAVAYGADRLLLKMEERGWIYWRNRHGTSDRIGEAALRLQAILEPSKQYVIEEKQKNPEEERRSGEPPDGA